MQQADRQRLDTQVAQIRYRLARLCYVEGDENLTVRQHALGDFLATVARYQWFWNAQEEIIEIARPTPVTPDFKDIAHPVRGHQSQYGNASFDHCVGTHGCAVEYSDCPVD